MKLPQHSDEPKPAGLSKKVQSNQIPGICPSGSSYVECLGSKIIRRNDDCFPSAHEFVLLHALILPCPHLTPSHRPHTHSLINQPSQNSLVLALSPPNRPPRGPILNAPQSSQWKRELSGKRAQGNAKGAKCPTPSQTAICNRNFSPLH
jgi:hypothetical protein